jgi:hypothetical protein
MSIWKTTPPTNQDYPIWAYTDDSEDVVLIRSTDEHVPTRLPITWCKANIPQRPKGNVAEEQFWVLRRSIATTGWLPKDWFVAGYDYAKRCKGKCGCDKVQEAKSPFVSPEEYFEEEPYDSAFDERL